MNTINNYTAVADAVAVLVSQETQLMKKLVGPSISTKIKLKRSN